MSRPIIEVHNLSKRYNLGVVGATSLREEFGRLLDRVRGVPHPDPKEFWALRDVSFEVHQGEVVGIIGRNGAGKSTLLKILSRITEPTSGRAALRGRVASLLEVGTGFHPELTGRENVFLNGAILGMTRAEVRRKFDEIVAFSGVEKFTDTPVKHYSSGMYVRLAFAVAAHLEPEILIVDEVLAVGDADFQQKCFGKIQGISSEGRTILFVSHNMAAIRSLCRRAIMLEHGKIVTMGGVNKVTDSYLAVAQQKSGLMFDFTDRPRASGIGSRLQIERISINHGAGLWNGRSLDIEFTFRCFSDVADVSFGIGFCSRDGTRVLSIDSDIPGARWSFRSGESGVATARIATLLLEPDDYLLDVGARSGDNFALDYLSESGRVTVIPSDQTPAVIAMRESGRGGVRQPADWNMDRH